MEKYSVIGKSLPRVDGVIKAAGEAKFTADMVLPRMLYGKILRSSYPHVLVALQKSRKRRSWLPVIWALGKSIHCRHFFKEQISVLLPEQDVTG